MIQTELEIVGLGLEKIDPEQEQARMAALTAADILDTPPEASFDTIAKVAGEFFHADAAGIYFADETRAWMKAGWGRLVRELPRKNSVCDLVLAQNGPVIVSDVERHPQSQQLRPRLKHARMSSFAAAPVRSPDGNVLGTLSLFRREPGEIVSDEQFSVLIGLAELVSNQVELRRLRKNLKPAALKKPHSVASVNGHWPTAADLRQALDQRQFVLFYQPEIDLVTREIVGLEALIRWNHPEKGMIPPMDFIPQAEETGMILPIGDWGLAEACSQIQKWSQENADHVSLRVCVNLSARQFSRVGLADHVEALLLEFGISSRQLGLEMTESSIIPNRQVALKVLGSLRRLGVSLLMDDFGTGYSSLNNLHSFPFDVLKIDRSFVGRMTEGVQPLQIVRTIIELARVLNMNVVAEGIETREQYRLLLQMGCSCGQGYLMARPMSVEAVTQLLRLPGRILPDPEMCAASFL
jgi:EAL domain-containing protein (putative c-di-GMP-specific phosphodiesterase class I)